MILWAIIILDSYFPWLLHKILPLAPLGRFLAESLALDLGFIWYIHQSDYLFQQMTHTLICCCPL